VDCYSLQDVVSPMTCASILTEYDITMADFYHWNPAVGPECAGLWLGKCRLTLCYGYITLQQHTKVLIPAGPRLPVLRQRPFEHIHAISNPYCSPHSSK
jgi:hypothetical protein